MHYNTLFGIAGAHFIRADYEEAVRWLEKGLAEKPNAAWVYHFLTPAYANAGRIEDARWAASKLRAAYPSITISQIIQVVPALGKLSVYAGRLRKAGLSERGRLNHLADRIFPDKQAAGWFGRTRCLGGAGLQFSLSALASHLLNDLDDLAGARIHQHGTLVHDGVAIGVSQSHARRDRRKPGLRRDGLPHCHGFSKSDRGTPSGAYVGAHACPLLGAESPANCRTRNATNCRSNWATHESTNNSTTSNARGKAGSCVGLAGSQWKSNKAENQGGQNRANTHGSSLRETKRQRHKA
jgi:hypothetical protein